MKLLVAVETKLTSLKGFRCFRDFSAGEKAQRPPVLWFPFEVRWQTHLKFAESFVSPPSHPIPPSGVLETNFVSLSGSKAQKSRGAKPSTAKRLPTNWFRGGFSVFFILWGGGGSPLFFLSLFSFLPLFPPTAEFGLQPPHLYLSPNRLLIHVRLSVVPPPRVGPTPAVPVFVFGLSFFLPL